ncbi:hypothetical protein [Aestuariivirga sp.]|uniref:hypothetical protein n=1 Tax=Aestuariivirga sp. TaxID=2650926 RepID=UPI003BAB0EA3
MPDRRSLPPMEAIEFAIEKVFRHFFFGLALAIAWAVLLIPLMALVWYFAFRNGMPDVKALPPAAMAAFGLLAIGLLLAAFSISANWNRRLLLGERPRGLAWLRLDGVVWRLMLGHVLLIVALGLYAAAAYSVVTFAAPSAAETLGSAAKPIAIVIAALLGLSALFTFYRLSSWLAGLAVADADYTLRTAWRSTAKNRIAYLSFTFWLLFSLAIAGALGAGAFFAQQSLPQPWVKPVAFGFIGLLAWLAIFLVASVAACHYRSFANQSKTENDTLFD